MREGSMTDDARISGVRKTVRDTLCIAELKILMMANSWHITFLSAIAFPLPLYYLTKSIALDEPGTVQRLLAGTIVYGVSFATGMIVGQQFVAERFLGTLKLVVTMPVSKVSYVMGSLIHASITGMITLMAILVFAFVTGIRLDLTWAFVPIVVLTVLSLAGLTLFITSFSPSMQVGNTIAALAGGVLAIVSPVYFTMDQAPVALRWLGYISPLRYAADGIAETISGGTEVGMELAFLSLSSSILMSLGLWKLPWQER